jgi:DNA mismatch repair protein MutH
MKALFTPPKWENPQTLCFSLFNFKISPKHGKVSQVRGKRMASKKIVYPKSLKDIPLWRRRQLTQDLLWFSKFSPAERLRYIDREWEEVQTFIDKFGFKNRGTRKRS